MSEEILEIMVRDALEPVLIEGDFASFIQDLNMAAARGHQYVIAQEASGNPVAFETRNITTIRPRAESNAFFRG